MRRFLRAALTARPFRLIEATSISEGDDRCDLA